MTSSTTRYTVRLCGNEVGTYNTAEEADEVYCEWRDEGYDKNELDIDEWIDDE